MLSEVDLEVMSVGMRRRRSLVLNGVLVVDRLPPSLEDSVVLEQETRPWRHLQGITTSAGSHTRVELLIGLDAPQALMPLEVRHGRDGAPFAVRTCLGWTVNGPVGCRQLREPESCNTGMVCIQHDCNLEVQTRRFWELETELTKDEEDSAMSVEDKRVLELWSSCIEMVAGHYRLPIPFRRRSPNLPDNKPLAERRLLGLKRRLERDPLLRQRYAKEMQQLLESGCAEKVPVAELNANPGLTWYLPSHPVLNPNKPEKVRIVFDCAATYNSVSLNNQVLQGPDLNNKLIGVLLRFRQREIGVMADIESMFHQVQVSPQHRDALRFLWWEEGDLLRAPRVYRMKVHLFGGVWSPSCAAYALQRTLDDHGGEFPMARHMAKRNFYVDDLLLSVTSSAEASELSKQLRLLLARGGFHLTKWMSNCKDVLQSIPARERHAGVKEVDLNRGALPVERALGIMWDLQDDQFAVRISIKHRPVTRRGILSVISSVYDPLGFVSPVTIRGKMIFQDECRRREGWDAPLTEQNQRAWDRWIEDLGMLSTFRISRCYTQRGLGPIHSAQLHHFCDASQRAYGVVSYLRLTDALGDNWCSFVFGKARLAPLKQVTIPRLELCAATLAAKIDKHLKEELEMDLDESVFWTDSTTALQYIANTEKRFRTFVANRVASIRERTRTDQWRYVHTASNPADDATRGMAAETIVVDNRWSKGPPFLWLNESHWPERPNVIPDFSNDPEVLNNVAALVTGTAQSKGGKEGNGCPLLKLWTYYSSWHRLLKGIAWIKRFIKWLTQGRQGAKAKLQVDDLRKAKRVVLKLVQEEQFSEEMKEVAEKGRITRQRAIYRLEPFIAENGLFCVGGRLKHAPLRSVSKHPILLPAGHPVTELIVRDTHETLAAHSGRNHTLALLRHEYWIPKCRRVLDRVIKKCIICRRNNWQQRTQRQAALPVDRVTPGGAPFASTGVDCFGPFLIAQGRKRFKRWGCLFTCMATRAVHLEVLMSLDTDAFLNALTRFSARRGLPEQMRSDNGTNLVGADKELRAAMKKWEKDTRIQDKLLRQQVKWVFNPPTASHMGGVWERQIRTVRKVLRAVVGLQVLDDDRLHTLFCEAESVLNSRPLTPLSEDPNDLEALTPSHLLRVGAHYSLPLGGPIGEDNGTYRKKWKHAQFLADRFWKRWLKEYLPTLRQRQKNLLPLRNFQKDDLVIITDDQMPRSQWKLGRIIEAKVSDDGLVRQVTVRTARGQLTRPACKICLLEGQPHEAEDTS